MVRQAMEFRERKGSVHINCGNVLTMKNFFTVSAIKMTSMICFFYEQIRAIGTFSFPGFKSVTIWTLHCIFSVFILLSSFSFSISFSFKDPFEIFDFILPLFVLKNGSCPLAKLWSEIWPDTELFRLKPWNFSAIVRGCFVYVTRMFWMRDISMMEVSTDDDEWIVKK